MAYTFNADEIFKIAEQIERNGGAFYRKAAKLISDEEAQKLMLSLAKMEDEHESFFADLRERFAPQEAEETVYDPDGEAVRYLEAFAAGYVFESQVKPEDRFSGSETVEEVIKIAMGFEKDAIVFFLGIKEFVPKSLGKDKIDALIREEQGHIVILSNALQSWKNKQRGAS